MASIKDLATTAKDILKGKTTVGGAVNAAKSNPKGIIGGKTTVSAPKPTGQNYTPANQSRQPAGTSLVKTTSGGGGSSSGGGSSKSSSSSKDLLRSAVDDQEDAAEQAAEAALKAAKNRYKETEMAAGVAKEQAGGNYQWLIDTIGTNKQDVLSKVALQETEGIESYGAQEKGTGEKYDKARQEILQTYRDLNLQQEKILRGSGTQSSSRSQEAALRLNNLMGKDLTSISKNEADSLALIGNALTKFKENVGNTKTSIEREAQTKLDKSALEYKAQLDEINQTVFKAKNEKAEAYEQAELTLRQNIASISTWAAQLQMEADQYYSTAQGGLDNLITGLTDDKGLLNAGLADKVAATNEVLSASGYTPLSQNDSGVTDNKVGVYQKAKSKYATLEDLQDAVDRGEISAGEAEGQRVALAGGGSSSPLTLQNNRQSKDSLLAAILA